MEVVAPDEHDSEMLQAIDIAAGSAAPSAGDRTSTDRALGTSDSDACPPSSPSGGHSAAGGGG